jgi:hypothetical protein
MSEITFDKPDPLDFLDIDSLLSEEEILLRDGKFSKRAVVIHFQYRVEILFGILIQPAGVGYDQRLRQ